MRSHPLLVLSLHKNQIVRHELQGDSPGILFEQIKLEQYHLIVQQSLVDTRIYFLLRKLTDMGIDSQTLSGE